MRDDTLIEAIGNESAVLFLNNVEYDLHYFACHNIQSSQYALRRQGMLCSLQLRSENICTARNTLMRSRQHCFLMMRGNRRAPSIRHPELGVNHPAGGSSPSGGDQTESNGPFVANSRKGQLRSLIHIPSVANTEGLRIRALGYLVRLHSPRSLPRILATNPPRGSRATSAFTLSRVSATVPLFFAAFIVIEYAAQTSAPVISLP